jgi:hypothetical protein
MNSRAFVPACLWLIAVSGAALAEPRRQKLVPWEKFDEEDGVVLFRREVPGSGIVALRGEGLVDASLLRVGSVLLDTSRSTEWIEGLAETRIVRRISRTEHVQWDHFSGTMGLLDRDFVFKVKLELKPRDKQVVLSFHSVKDSAAPKTPYVRGDVYGSYVLTPVDGGRRTRVAAEVLCDPKGSIAKWVANLRQRRWPYKTIANLRRQVQKPGLEDSRELLSLFERERFLDSNPSRDR